MRANSSSARGPHGVTVSQRFGGCTAKFLGWSIIGTAVRVSVDVAAPLPRRGAFVLACNHISHFDPPILGAWLSRTVDWMAMEELFEDPLADRILRWMGAFPVNRDGSDRTALRIALRRLEQGRVVGIFPEGGIRAGEGSVLNGAPMRAGVALLAAMSQKPIIPAVILGSDRLYQPKNWLPIKRVPVWIATGEPIACPGRNARDDGRVEVTRRLGEAFMSLKSRLVQKHNLRPDDLPVAPQARKGADPIPFSRRRPD